MEKDKVQNDKVQPDDEISSEDLDNVAGGTGYVTNTALIGTFAKKTYTVGKG